jgi:hypothetical protein
MEAKNNNINELQEISPVVASIGIQNPYSVPQDYFNSLAESVLLHVQLSQLRNTATATPFSVPEGYFENLAGSILSNTRNGDRKNEVQEELSAIAPLLNTIHKGNTFSVPHDYFEKFSVPVKPERKESKIISLSSNIRKWVTYSAAASVLFIIATTSYLYVTIHSKNIEKHLPIEQRIAELNEQEILNYLKDNDGITSGNFIPAAAEDPEIQHMLQRVSDEEIENYLDNYGDENEKQIKGI